MLDLNMVLDDLKARYRRVQIMLDRSVELPAQWPHGVESVRNEGRVISILTSGNVDAVIEQAQSLPGATVELYPVTLKEMFLEHVRTD